MYKIFSNNLSVADKYPEFTQFQAGDVYSVFAAVRDAVHKGAKLISHPLSGSVKPNESPYKSIALDIPEHHKNALDYKSLQIIEDAITTLEKLPKTNREYTEAMLEDFRVIDLDLISNAV